MRNETFEVKSQGKVIGETDAVPQFDNIAEAIEHFESETPGKGESSLLDKLNGVLSTAAINARRAQILRPPSPMKALRKKIKADPTAQAELNALLSKLGLPQFEQ